MSVFQNLLALMILKSAPQDLPYSPQLLLRLAVLYVFSGLLVLQSTLNPDQPLAGILLGLAVQFLFVYIVLNALHHRPRFVQTFSAMVGAGILFNLLSWPVFAMLSDATMDDGVKSTMSLLFLLLISWELLVKAYILKHALEMRMFGALTLSLSLFFISIALSQLLLPAESAA